MCLDTCSVGSSPSCVLGVAKAEMLIGQQVRGRYWTQELPWGLFSCEQLDRQNWRFWSLRVQPPSPLRVLVVEGIEFQVQLIRQEINDCLVDIATCTGKLVSCHGNLQIRNAGLVAPSNQRWLQNYTTSRTILGM